MRGKLLQHHALARYTSWKIGGSAEYFYQPVDLIDLQLCLQKNPVLPITILGAGTNVLISDAGVRGTVICLRNCLKQITTYPVLPCGIQARTDLTANTKKNTKIPDSTNCDTQQPYCNLRIEAGASLSLLLNYCINLGATDAVFMSGIPGTVGGALAMNAGANGGSIWQYVKAVEVINLAGQISTKAAQEFNIGYRCVTGLKANEWFIAAHLQFNITTDQDKINQAKQKIASYLQKRKDTQPLDLPNCGSVFRNPPNDFAARLIEASGFKGRRIGGAQVSIKHANFIVNQANATACDVWQLMQSIILKVKHDHNIALVPEVRIIT